MELIKFKILMYCGQYVDVNLLEKGIYISSKPVFYSTDESIGNLIKTQRDTINRLGIDFVSETYFENLNQCELVDVKFLFLNE